MVHSRKSLTDATGGLVYSLGCSLVHFALFITILLIKRADEEGGAKLDKEFASKIHSMNDPLASKHMA